MFWKKVIEREDHLIVREVAKNCRIFLKAKFKHLFNNTIAERIKVGKEFTLGWQTKKPHKQEKTC